MTSWKIKRKKKKCVEVLDALNDVPQNLRFAPSTFERILTCTSIGHRQKVNYFYF